MGDQFLHYISDAGAGSPWFVWSGSRTHHYAAYVYMTAFLYDKDSKLSQGFATGYTVSDDGKTYTVHINPDAIFTDGTKLTAAAAKRAYEFSFQPVNQQGWGSTITVIWNTVEGTDPVIDGEREDATGIVVVDEETLQFNLKQATPNFPGRLAVYLNGMFKADLAWEDPDFFLNPVGVGPYTASSDTTNNTITLTATDNWWGDRPIIRSALGRWATGRDYTVHRW